MPSILECTSVTMAGKGRLSARHSEHVDALLSASAKLLLIPDSDFPEAVTRAPEA